MHHAIIWVPVGGLLALAALETQAAAQEELSDVTKRMPAPSQALELKVGTGYTQGFGKVAPGRGLPDVAGPGLGIGAEVDYRMTQRWSIGLEGQYQTLSNEQNSTVRGAAMSFGGTYHLEPVLRGNPWARVGTGFRWLWEYDPTGAPGTTVVRSGLEPISVKLGFDLRASEQVALAPVVGADLDTFIWESGTSAGNHTLSPAEVGVFIYAGVQGRFDIGAQEETVATLPSVQVTAVSVPAPRPVAPPPAPPVAQTETRRVAPSIAVSEDVQRACQADIAAIDKAPKFELDEARLLPADLSVLRQIGTCFATGPLKGMTMVLVGRADPRGTVEHNQKLGERRASNVAAYLTEIGVDPRQVEQTSRGDLDASGTDEAGWEQDRRVDVLLGPPVSAK